MTANAKTMIMVISLPSSIDRRRTMLDFSHAAASEWQFHDASQQQHKDLSISYNLITKFGRVLTAPEIACYSSHFVTWRSLLQSNCEQMIVFEDDVCIDWAAIEKLCSVSLADENIDVLRLFGTNFAAMSIAKQCFLSPHHHLMKSRGLMLGLQGYMITRRAAAKLVKVASPIEKPVDWLVAQYWLCGLRSYVLFPFPIFERMGSSTLQTDLLACHAKLTPAQVLQKSIYRINSRLKRLKHHLRE